MPFTRLATHRSQKRRADKYRAFVIVERTAPRWLRTSMAGWKQFADWSRPSAQQTSTPTASSPSTMRRARGTWSFWCRIERDGGIRLLCRWIDRSQAGQQGIEVERRVDDAV